MRLHRFYVEKQPLGEEVHIDDKDLVHQWFSVFRYKAGDRVRLFSLSSLGNDYDYKITTISKKEVFLSPETRHKNICASSPKKLYVSIVKKDTFETIVRQATELLVTDIIPVISARSEKKSLNHERLLAIIRESAEQCGRGDMPKLHTIMNFTDAVLEATPAHYILDTTTTSSYTTLHPEALWIGPEGGWEQKEIDLLQKQGAISYSLGATTLRADTACVAALSSIF